jgi:SAM-dependent methyltransferase
VFSIITKVEFFSYAEQGFASLARQELKNVQDAFVLANIGDMKNQRILEIGGGQSRVLPRLHQSNELWNADRLEGDGNGPTDIETDDRIRMVRSFLSEFDSALPNEYFDITFSISTVEHIPGTAMDDFIEDTIRVLKPGGIALHAVDLYIGDSEDQKLEVFQNQNQRIERYRSLVEKRPDQLEWIETPELETPAVTSGRYAVNSNNTLYRWSRRAPKLRSVREIAQSVSLKWGFRKKPMLPG